MRALNYRYIGQHRLGFTNGQVYKLFIWLSFNTIGMMVIDKISQEQIEYADWEEFYKDWEQP